MSDVEIKDPVTEVLLPREIDPPRAGMAHGAKRVHVAHQNLAALEDDILDTSYNIIKDVLRFRDVDPSLAEVPPEWVDEVGLEEATKRFRLALSGWSKRSEMLAGVSLAQDTYVGISKAKSKQPAQHVHLTANYVVLPKPQEYPELVEETDDEA